MERPLEYQKRKCLCEYYNKNLISIMEQIGTADDTAKQVARPC